VRILRILLPALVLAALVGASPAQAIVGGAQASPNEYPHQVRVLMATAGGNYSCGGSIRDATHVVTAAHCVYIDDTLLAPANVAVGYGSIDRRTLTTAAVTEVTMPAAYLTDDSHDVAVLELAVPLTFGPSVNFIPLATAAELAAGTGPEANAVATGWGATSEGGAGSTLLREVTLPLRPDTICSAFYAPSYVSARSVCAGGKGAAASNNPDTCQGDSGGPLALNGELVGITSYGLGCGRTLTPAAYTESSNPAIQAVIEGTAPPSSTLRGSENQSPPVSGGAPPVTLPVEQAPAPPSPVIAARDTIRPTARLSRLSCSKRRRCSFRIRASDNGARVARLSAKVSRRVGSRTRTRTLKPRRISGGFAIAVTLSKATYRLNAVATDAAGNRSRVLTKKFRVR